MLKIAGVKTESAFYKKYPTQAAFMKVHGKEFKKAQQGVNMNTQGDTNKNGIPDYLEYTPNQSFGPQNQWKFGNNMSNTPSFGAPTAGQMAGNTFQPSPDPFAMQNYGDQWSQNNPLPQKGTGKISNSVFTSELPNDNKGAEPFNMQGPMKVFTGAIEGYKNLQKEKEYTNRLDTWANVTDVVKKAAISNAYMPKEPNQWFRQDDPRFIQSTGELYNQQGRGSDVIGQNGSSIGGNRTEVQNTYSDGITLYDDLGYTPLEENDETKMYQNGGSWFSQVNNSLGGNSSKGFIGNMGQGSPIDPFISSQFGNNAGSQLGGSLGSIGGPLGSLAGTAIGGYLDKEQGEQAFRQGRINENTGFINNLSMAGDFHNQFSQVTQNGGDLPMYEEGGYMNPEYNPQVITMFGDHNAEDFDDYAHKYRAGGHLKEYTPPSEEAMETYALGGKLQSHWGGNVEDISYNPYMPGSGKTAMINGASHNDDGVGISYRNSQNGYNEGYAANGAEMKAKIEAEGGEPVIEMAEGGNINPQTGEQETSAVIAGNIPVSLKMAEYTENPDLIRIATKNPNRTFKTIIANYSNEENKAIKLKEKAADISNNADKTNGGKLDEQTAFIIDKSGDMKLKKIAEDKMLLVTYQNTLHKLKDELSQAKGKNISAEALGRGLLKIDKDPITKNAPLNQAAKFGANLKIAQGGINESSEEAPRIDEATYNKLVKLYEQGKKDKKSSAVKEFQHLYHQYFPKEAMGAIQKTTKERGVTAKGKQMGLTKEEILAGKDTGRILESNEDEFFGPRTEQYMANINADFNKTPKTKDLQLTSLGTPAVNATSSKTPIGVVPYKRNKLIDVANMISPLFQKNNLPGIDPRQFAKEYLTAATNAVEPVQSQRAPVQLDPLTRISYQELRDATTADFREAEKQLAGNPAALASLYGKKFMSNQPGYAEEFRTNQGLESQIFGGNRAKVNQNVLTNLQLDANQRDLQEKAKSITKDTQRELVGSIADKNLQHEARNLEYNVKKNLFPQFGFNASGNIRNQGPWYQPNIPQIYGGKETIKEVPVYGADGKIQYYKMEENNPTTTTNMTTAIVKNGKSITKNNRNGSVVKAYKNL